MKHSQGRGQPERRSAWLAKTKRRIDESNEFGSIRFGEAHSKPGSEDEGVIVGQVEVVTPGPNQAAPAELEVEEEAEGTRGDEVSSEESDTMPSTTCLKYSRFKGDGSQDVDDWLTEFKSTAIANQEEPATTLRIFQGLLKGEALKWTRMSWTGSRLTRISSLTCFSEYSVKLEEKLKRSAASTR